MLPYGSAAFPQFREDVDRPCGAPFRLNQNCNQASTGGNELQPANIWRLLRKISAPCPICSARFLLGRPPSPFSRACDDKRPASRHCFASTNRERAVGVDVEACCSFSVGLQLE